MRQKQKQVNNYDSYWYLMTEKPCSSVTMKSTSTRGGEGFGKSGHGKRVKMPEFCGHLMDVPVMVFGTGLRRQISHIRAVLAGDEGGVLGSVLKLSSAAVS